MREAIVWFCLSAVWILLVGCQPPAQPRNPLPPPVKATEAIDPGPAKASQPSELRPEDVSTIAVTEYVPDAAHAPPVVGNFGYNPPTKEQREQFLQTLEKPTLKEAAPHLFAPQEEAEPIREINETSNQTRGPPQAAKPPVLLYRALYEVSPGWTVGRQGIGDCVSWGWAHGCDILLAIDKKLGKPVQWKPAATESLYGGGRVEGRGKREGTGGWSDGSYGAAQAAWMNKYGGVIYREPFTELGFDLTNYSSSRAKSWGHWGNGGQGDNGRLDAIAKKRPVRQVALVTTFESAAAAIENGYPIPVCSGQGFSKTRDTDGFCRASGSWAHCMVFIGVRYDRPGLLCLNSWGPNWVSGPKYPDDQPDGSFWVDKVTAESMLRGKDSYAISGIEGFPARKLDHAKGW